MKYNKIEKQLSKHSHRNSALYKKDRDVTDNKLAF